MIKKIFLYILPIILITFGFNSLANANQFFLKKPPDGIKKTDQIIVKYKTIISASHSEKKLTTLTGINIRYKKSLNKTTDIYKLSSKLSESELKPILARIQADNTVDYAEADKRIYPDFANDPLFASQWHYASPTSFVSSINLPLAWNSTTGSNTIFVSVVDTGVTNHIDLDGNLSNGSASQSGYDFIDDVLVGNDGNLRDNNPSDPGDWITTAESLSGYFFECEVSPSSWHGTHVAGTIGAETNNSQGVAGVNWDVRLLAARVLGKCGGYTSDIAAGIIWSAGGVVSGVPINPTPARVINMSLGGQGACPITEQNAINEAINRGSIVIVSAGNANKDASLYSPSNCNNVISVAALTNSGARASFSNYGSSVDIAAPGVGILSTINQGTTTPTTDTYAYYNGTSMAAPHVSGTVALMLAANSRLLDPTYVNQSTLATLIEQKLKLSSRSFVPAGSNSCSVSLCGSGMLDAYQALKAVTTAPIANAGNDQLASVGSTVYLNALASSDDEYNGTIVSYFWNQISGPTISLQNANSSQANFMISAGSDTQTITLQLTVTDDTGLSGTDTINIIVSGDEPIDQVPDQFFIPSVVGTNTSTDITSATITLTGFEQSTTISISNGMYSLGVNGNYTAFTNSPGLVSPEQTLRIKHTSSNLLSTNTTTSISIGGVNGYFRSRTRSN